MKRGFLEKLLNVIEDESIRKSIIDSILDENGNDLNAEKAKTESVKNDLKVKESLIDELNEKIKSNADFDIDKIKQEEFNRGKEEGSKEFDEFKKQTALKGSIKDAKDFDLVFSKLNKDLIKYEKQEDGNYKVSGIDEQIETLKKDYDYLFNTPETEENPFQGPQVNLGGSHEGAPTNEGFNFNFAGVRPQENNK